MIEAMCKDFKERFNDNENNNMVLFIAHTQNYEAAEEFREEVLKVFPGMNIEIDDLSLSVSCHIGPSALALACGKCIK